MAKRDETPIRFYIPGPGGRRPKIPLPINQPHWVYTHQKPPTIFETILCEAVGILLVSLAIAAFVFAQINSRLEILIMGIMLVIGSGFILLPVIQMLRWKSFHADVDQTNKVVNGQNKKEQKRSKRRKDFG